MWMCDFLIFLDLPPTPHFKLWAPCQTGLLLLHLQQVATCPTHGGTQHMCVACQEDHIVHKDANSPMGILQCVVISHWGQALRCLGTRVSIWFWVRGWNLKISLPSLAGVQYLFLLCDSLTHYCIGLHEHTPELSFWLSKGQIPVPLALGCITAGPWSLISESKNSMPKMLLYQVFVLAALSCC